MALIQTVRRRRAAALRKCGLTCVAGLLAALVVTVTPTEASSPTTPTFIQAASSTTKKTIPFVNAVAAGDLLVAGITTNDGGTDPVTGVSDNLNGAWTKLTSLRYGNGHVDLYYHGNSAAGVVTVTFAGSQASYSLAEYAGVQASATPVDQFAGRTGTGSPAAGPTAAIQAVGELVVGIGGNPAPASSPTQFSAGTGFTLRTQAVAPFIGAVGLEDALSSSVAGQSMTMKPTNSSYFGAIVAVFKATPPPAPRAALSVNPSSGASPLTVTADASASSDPVGITSYAFAFGDGTTAGPQPTPTAGHTYNAGGTYSAQVTITDTAGATATASATVLVGAPVAALAVNPTTGVTPFQVTADASGSTDPIGIAAYTFTFGDGSAQVGPQPGATAKHTYSVPGSFTVTVTAKDAAGASANATAVVTSVAPPTAALSVAPSSGAAPLGVTADASSSAPGSNPIATYTFDFGDATPVVGPQAGATASHTYSAGGQYTVRVTVTDTASNSAFAARTVTVGAPVASLTVTPSAGGAPLLVTANASSSTDPIGIASYTFNFGDGTPAVGPQATASASHTYTSGGTFIAVVSVADSTGTTATASATVTVGQPVAGLAVSPSSGPAPLAVTADASASTDPVAVSTYTFKFGDGTTVGPQSSAKANHTYAAGGNFTVQVTIVDVAGASATASRAVSVGAPVAAVKVNPSSGGAPLNVTADASASTDPIGIASYSFDFGDGTTVGPQPGATATHTYTATGPYTVTVTVRDSTGASAFATAGVSVAVPPSAAVTAAPASGPAPLSVTADASASTPGTNPIATYRFNFGDGSAVVGPQASATATHLYSAGGNYVITVTVTDTIGVSATATTGVTAVAPPTAALALSPSSGAIPLAVTADASGSKAGSNPIASYTFNFGDGSALVGPQAGSSATHTYNTSGTFTVTVTVTDTSATAATASASVTAVAPPVAELNLSTQSGGAPLAVTADGSPSIAGSNPIASYSFDFGDGTVVGPQASSNASHTYTGGGAFTVTLTVKDTAGYASTNKATVSVGAPVASIQASPNLGPTPLGVTADASASSDPIGITTYTFDFGDGTLVGPQAGPNAAHTYSLAGTYTITVTVRDGVGASASATTQVKAVTPPSAALMASPGLGAIPLAVTADASGSTPGTNPIASYTFDFGDGTKVGPQAAAMAQHTYTVAGAYVVRVTVTDTQGISAGATVSETAVTPPTPHLNLTPPSGGVPLLVAMDGSASTPGTNAIATYQFSYGDGSPSSAPSATPSVQHTYSSVGTYTVTLVVTDTAGVSASQQATVTVVNPPNAALTVTPGSGGAPLTVNADASASSDALGIASYTFDFGDGSAVVGPQTGAKATHVYTTAGNFTVTLTVTDSAHATSVATAPVDVVAPPAASLSENPISGYAPLSVIANGSGSAGGSFAISTFTFNFGDGTAVVGPQANPQTSHVYVNPGSFTTVLTVTDTQGNTGTASATVTVASGVLTQDSFTRANQTGWGTASNGAAWAPAGLGLTISSNEGMISYSGSSQFESLGTGTISDANGLVRFSIASTTDAAGILLRGQSNGNMYLGRYDGAGHLQFEYRAGSTWTHVSLVPFTPSINTFYWLRFQVQGGNVNLKAWAYGTSEPAAWSWSGVSTGFTTAGQMGLYGYAGSGTPVMFDSFSVSAVGNPVPNSNITGTLTDVNTGAPIAGVQVSTLPLTTTATTNGSGLYSLNLPAGNFAVVFTASGVGYNANFVGGVQAPPNGTVSANQSLTPIPAQTAMDSFTRPNQSNGFGTSTDGNLWASDLGTYPGAQAGITNSQAWVDTQASSQTDFDTWTGNQFQNQVVTVDLNMNTILVDPVFQHGARLLARLQNSTTWILLSINPTAQDLELWATLNNNWTQLVSVTQPISTNAWYHAKLSVIDNSVQGKIWQFGTSEPGWQITATQHIVNGTGQGGLRTTGAYVQYANFKQVAVTQIAGTVTSASNGAPIAGATVSLSNGAITTTDAFGNYSFTGLIGGTAYTLTASAPGKTQSTQQVTPPTATTAIVNIALGP